MKTIIPCCALILGILLTNINVQAQTAPPPAFGEDTKGEPAVPEVDEAAAKQDSAPQASRDSSQTNPDEETQSFANNLLGEATIKELRRESGQIYRIELEHSSGSKQIIEENDSDGSIESDGIDLEDTPNLPKWKLGSW